MVRILVASLRGAGTELIDRTADPLAAYTDANAALRPRETAVVILQPRLEWLCR